MTTVLIIEDDKILRENIQELLEVNGYAVYSAPDGKKGVELALSKRPDVIICDIIMPELDGFQVLEILNREQITDNIPFIFLTAKTELLDIRRGMNLGADDYLTKPFEEDDLLSSIESRLDKLRHHNEFQDRSRVSSKRNSISSLARLKEFIRDKGSFIEFNKNEVLYSEGEKASYTYLLEDGIVKIHKMDDWGKEIIVDILNKGDFVGIGYFSTSTCAEAATALQTGCAYKIFNDHLRETLTDNPAILMELAGKLSQELSDLQDHLLDTAYSGVLKKTAQAIFYYSKKMKITSGDIIRISRGDLANFAGISTESFIRCLAHLKNENVVQLEGRYIKILDLKRLEHIR